MNQMSNIKDPPPGHFHAITIGRAIAGLRLSLNISIVTLKLIQSA